MTKAALIEQIKRKESFLCVGLDPDLTKIPAHLLQTKTHFLNFARPSLMQHTRMPLHSSQIQPFLNVMGPQVGSLCAKP